MARGISVVYQDLAIIPLLAVWRNFFLGREENVSRRLPFHCRLKAREMRREARDALHDLGIHIDDVELTVAKLSGGEQQSIAIARAVYFDSRVLILDEPTAALSLKEPAKVLSYIDQARNQSVAVVFIAHNINSLQNSASAEATPAFRQHKEEITMLKTVCRIFGATMLVAAAGGVAAQDHCEAANGTSSTTPPMPSPTRCGNPCGAAPWPARPTPVSK